MPAFALNHWMTELPKRPGRRAYEWHRALDGYAPTPLRDAPELAARIGLDRLWVKDETLRFGMPAFKILGVSWAVRSALHSRPDRPVLVAATDGNHGHAVGRVAAQHRCRALVFVPGDTSAARIDRIRGEGADVEVVEGDFDTAVATAARFAAERDDAVLISDTALEPGELTPEAVVDGYGTLFWEIGEQLATAGAAPDLVVVQVGSGGLAAAAGRYFRHAELPVMPYLCGIEPVSAGCAVASVGQPEAVQIVSTFGSVMAGLNAGRLSAAAWPDISAAYDGFVTIEDDWCFAAQAMLREVGIRAGETGASGFAGLLALRHLTEFGRATQNPGLSAIRAARSALVIVTEGMPATS